MRKEDWGLVAAVAMVPVAIGLIVVWDVLVLGGVATVLLWVLGNG